MSRSKFQLTNAQKDILCKAFVERNLGKGKGLRGMSILIDCINEYSVKANDLYLVGLLSNTKMDCNKFERIQGQNGITLDIKNSYYAYFRENQSFPNESLWNQLSL